MKTAAVPPSQLGFLERLVKGGILQPYPWPLYYGYPVKANPSIISLRLRVCPINTRGTRVRRGEIFPETLMGN